MNRFFFLLILLIAPYAAFSKPYYSEYVETQPDKEFFVIFYGNIQEEDEPKVKVLERRYLEHKDGYYLEFRSTRQPIEKELNQLGVNVEVMENYDWHRSQKIEPPQLYP